MTIQQSMIMDDSDRQQQVIVTGDNGHNGQPQMVIMMTLTAHGLLACAYNDDDDCTWPFSLFI
jgi:hypothetical protein